MKSIKWSEDGWSKGDDYVKKKSVCKREHHHNDNGAWLQWQKYEKIKLDLSHHLSRERDAVANCQDRLIKYWIKLSNSLLRPENSKTSNIRFYIIFLFLRKTS